MMSTDATIDDLIHTYPRAVFLRTGAHLMLYSRATDEELFRLPLSVNDIDALIDTLKNVYDQQQVNEANQKLP